MDIRDLVLLGLILIEELLISCYYLRIARLDSLRIVNLLLGVSI